MSLLNISFEAEIVDSLGSLEKNIRESSNDFSCSYADKNFKDVSKDKARYALVENDYFSLTYDLRAKYDNFDLVVRYSDEYEISFDMDVKLKKQSFSYDIFRIIVTKGPFDELCEGHDIVFWKTPKNSLKERLADSSWLGFLFFGKLRAYTTKAHDIQVYESVFPHVKDLFASSKEIVDAAIEKSQLLEYVQK